MAQTTPIAPNATVRPRPAMLRALGNNEPPAEIEVGGNRYEREEVLKHDSWAATALYISADHGRIICKFNRQSPLVGLPARWLGHWLARREAFFLAQLADVGHVPELLPAVFIDGRVAKHACARKYIPGHPLGDREYVADDFFPELARVLREMHERGMAYVDLHKRENVIVGDDGRPYLIDFQISQAAQRRGLLGAPARAILRILQHCDRYHLQKLTARSRPDCLLAATGKAEVQRPLAIRLHRCIAVPFRTLRRKLLVLLHVRAAAGKAESEVFAEDAFRTAQRPAA